MWERGGSVSHRVSRLTHCYREQARSHIGFALSVRVGFSAESSGVASLLQLNLLCYSKYKSLTP